MVEMVREERTRLLSADPFSDYAANTRARFDRYFSANTGLLFGANHTELWADEKESQDCGLGFAQYQHNQARVDSDELLLIQLLREGSY